MADQLAFDVTYGYINQEEGQHIMLPLDTFPEKLRRRLSPRDPLIAFMREGGSVDPITVGDTENGLELVDGKKRVLIARMLGWSHISAMVHRMSHKQAMRYTASLNNVRSQNDLSDLDVVADFMSDFPTTANAKTIAYYTGIPIGRVKQLMPMVRLSPTLIEAVSEGVMTEATLEAIAKEPGAEEMAVNMIADKIADLYGKDEAGAWYSRKTGRTLSQPPILVTIDDVKDLHRVQQANAVQRLDLGLKVEQKLQGYVGFSKREGFLTGILDSPDEVKAALAEYGRKYIVGIFRQM